MRLRVRAGTPMPDLAAFAAALQRLAPGARVPLRYFVFTERHRMRTAILHVASTWRAASPRAAGACAAVRGAGGRTGVLHPLLSLARSRREQSACRKRTRPDLVAGRDVTPLRAPAAQVRPAALLAARRIYRRLGRHPGLPARRAACGAGGCCSLRIQDGRRGRRPARVRRRGRRGGARGGA